MEKTETKEITITLEVIKNLSFIIFAINQAKEAKEFGFSQNYCCRTLGVALRRYWQSRVLQLHNTGQKKKMNRSKAALNLPLAECRVEHCVPFKVVAERLMLLEPLTTESAFDLLTTLYAVRLITFEEDQLLLTSGLRSSMPKGWDGKDPLARYKAVGIEID